MKLPVISAVLLLMFSQNGLASYPKPDSCPSVVALQAVGVSYMVKDSDYWYGAVDSNHYGTADNWNFGIGVFRTPDEKEAKQQAIAALGLLKSPRGPIEISDGWLCSYTDDAGHNAVVVTPTMNRKSFLKLINF